MRAITDGFVRGPAGHRNSVDVEALLFASIIKGIGDVIPLARDCVRRPSQKWSKSGVVGNGRQDCAVLQRQSIRIKGGGAQWLAQYDSDAIGGEEFHPCFNRYGGWP